MHSTIFLLHHTLTHHRSLLTALGHYSLLRPCGRVECHVVGELLQALESFTEVCLVMHHFPDPLREPQNVLVLMVAVVWVAVVDPLLEAGVHQEQRPPVVAVAQAAAQGLVQSSATSQAVLVGLQSLVQ